MNELFRFQILHLKGDYCPEDFGPRICFHFDNRKSNSKSINPENPPNLERFTTRFSTH